jgi:hypothetical protein
MRLVLLCLALLFSLPAVAADWSHYDNARFGYGIAIPPGYTGQGEADNGDGEVFLAANGRETLTVWASNIVEGDFESEVAQRMEWAEGDGWQLSYHATNPNWASYSGTRSGSVLYARAVSLCDGSQGAFFTLEYPQADIKKLDAVVDKLVASLKGAGNC